MRKPDTGCMASIKKKNPTHSLSLGFRKGLGHLSMHCVSSSLLPSVVASAGGGRGVNDVLVKHFGR